MKDEYTRDNRISEALEMRGWKQVDLVERTGIAKSSINAWVKQNWQPRQKALMKMAQVLDVSEMWLAGYDAPIERAPEQKQADALVELFNQLRSDAEFKELVFKIRSDAEFKELVFKIRRLSTENYQTIKHLIDQLAD